MQKSKIYNFAKFSSETLKVAIEKIEQITNFPPKLTHATVANGEEEWSFDNVSDFYEAYRTSQNLCHLSCKFGDDETFTVVRYSNLSSEIAVKSNSRQIIQEIFSLFEEKLNQSKVPIPELHTERTSIFIGHGRSKQWRDLKDHLQDKHGYQISAYETGARAGHVIRDIIGELADKANMAFLVLTAEDEQSDGKFHARQNVIHETGLFQGRLGFTKAIVLLEDGTEAFSNLQGIDQIRFSKGNIKETFGEVLATIKRELL